MALTAKYGSGFLPQMLRFALGFTQQFLTHSLPTINIKSHLNKASYKAREQNKNNEKITSYRKPFYDNNSFCSR